MKNEKKVWKLSIVIAVAILALSVFAAMCMPASAATEAEIEQAIDDGVVWLAAQQNPDGSWGTSNQVAHTALALLKLCTHDPITYSDNISKGLDYMFANAVVVNISDQPAGNPDTNGNGRGVYFSGTYRMYEVGIAAMALGECACKTPDAVVNVPGSTVNGWTYEQVLQDVADFIAFAQNEAGTGRGGWRYSGNDANSDNSVAGYVTLGLGYAQESECGITIPSFVYDELNIWIDYIQDDVNGDAADGGSGYTGPDAGNIYRTGNLLFEMRLVGDDADTQRVQDAVDYIVRHWDDSTVSGWKGTPANYQAMFTTMKGLEVLGIDTIDGIDWFDEFSDVIVAQQNPDGSWPGTCYTGDNIMCTEWALLTLQKEVPLPPPPTAAPIMTPIGLIILVCLLSAIAAVTMRKRL